jgi:hypothetical protein
MAAANKRRSFHHELVLNQWLMSFFKGGSLEALKTRLGETRHEGLEDDGQSGFFYELQHNLFEVDSITEFDLRRYDLNIVQHWKEITERRNKIENTVLNMKYFQYLSLLFTEIYLDWYFNRPQELLDALNEKIAAYNVIQDIEHRFQLYSAEELNKLAFWNATGSGKTLLLHVNLKQYLHYFQNGKNDYYPDKVILLTPNEGLSRQHLEELQLSGFGFGRLFDKSSSGVFRGTIEVIDINKLSDEMGDKTVAVEAFEGNNLVLIDEGHKGTGTAAGAWMRRREVLVRGGFAFEYSATFGQAVAKGLTVLKAEEEIVKKKAKLLFGSARLTGLSSDEKLAIQLTLEEKRHARILATRETYAKNILFDYSYKFFYEDGYGKESLILNLKDDDYSEADIARQYFTACLLSFYQQQYLWSNNQNKLADFNIEKPLWVFVGNTVSGEDSDTLNVLKFLAEFLNNEVRTKQWIADLLSNTPRLLDAKGRNIFNNRFTPLMQLNADQVYIDILDRLFNVSSKQRLKLVNLKTTKGELALKVGNSDPFGLINIGDDAGFYNEAQKPENAILFDTEDDEFSPSMFGKINNKDSKLNVLIGSRKFTEGWSSWRVSTMGLLNMGKGEGSQIIQLFGRGVRLKGKDYSLKRSTQSQRPKGVNLEQLETLNIFGVNAGYMATFKEYLKEEGITPQDEIIEIDFETQTNLPSTQLKSLALKDGYKDNQIKGFKRSHFPVLYEVPSEFIGKIKLAHIELDLYPKLEAMAAGKQLDGDAPLLSIRHEGKIDFAHMAMFDFDRIYLAVQEFKLQRSWSNLRLDRQRFVDFCNQMNDWYTLLIPKAELYITKFSDIKKQEDILIRLLLDYTDRFYKSLKNAYEGQFYDIVKLNKDSDTLPKLIHFEIENNSDGEAYEKKLRALQQLVKDKKIGEANQWNAGQMVAISFGHHLYYPMFAIEGDVPLKMRPLAFDAPSEVQFVRDLESFYKSSLGQQVIGKRSIYLLRNADSKAKGLGFALAGNFYPDFLLWLVDDDTGQQWLSFVDPKGLRQMNLNDPKLGLYKEIKEIEIKLNDPKLVLNAFILSATSFSDLLNVTFKKSDLEDRNVLFMDDNYSVYLNKMFSKLELKQVTN